MSVETLHAAEHAAGLAIGLSEGDMRDIAESQRPRIVDLGMISASADGNGDRYHAVRVISGPAGMDKGGMRSRKSPNLILEATDLARKMDSKNQLITHVDGLPIRGGKTEIDVNPKDISPEQTTQLFYNLGRAMLDNGIAGHDKSVPAGDMGVGKDAIRAYALAIEESGDPYWQASVTGKPKEIGGLEFRPHATGYGVYLAALEMKRLLKIDPAVPADVTLSGIGQVGGYFAYHAMHDQEDKFKLTGISDQYGTLVATNGGMQVTKEFLAIADIPNYAGDKLDAIANLLAQQQPGLELRRTMNPSDIMAVKADIFVPASVPNIINTATAPLLGASGIVEAGNCTITDNAADILASREILVIPGALANILGVDCSMLEHGANIRAVRDNKDAPDFDESRKTLETNNAKRFAAVHNIAGELKTSNIELAVNALIVAQKAQRIGIAVDPRFIQRVQRDAYDLARS